MEYVTVVLVILKESSKYIFCVHGYSHLSFCHFKDVIKKVSIVLAYILGHLKF